MGNFKRRMARFFGGRNGVDALYYCLLVCYALVILIAWLVGTFFGNSLGGVIAYAVLYVLGLFLLFLIFFRVLSRNIAKRKKENDAFLRIFHKIFRRRGKKNKRPKDDEYYIFRNCKYCKALLRLPREPGRHQVRCPRCEQLFELFVDPK